MDGEASGVCAGTSGKAPMSESSLGEKPVIWGTPLSSRPRPSVCEDDSSGPCRYCPFYLPVLPGIASQTSQVRYQAHAVNSHGEQRKITRGYWENLEQMRKGKFVGIICIRQKPGITGNLIPSQVLVLILGNSAGIGVGGGIDGKVCGVMEL